MDRKLLKQVSDKIRTFLEDLGDPPHLISVVVGSEILDEEHYSVAVTTHVSPKLKMQDCSMMLGSIVANLCDHQPSKLPGMIEMIQESATSIMETMPADDLGSSSFGTTRPSELN